MRATTAAVWDGHDVDWGGMAAAAAEGGGGPRRRLEN
jgi:hypothetical protein